MYKGTISVTIEMTFDKQKSCNIFTENVFRVKLAFGYTKHTCVSVTCADLGPIGWEIATVKVMTLVFCPVEELWVQALWFKSEVRLAVWKSKKNLELVNSRVNKWSTCIGNVSHNNWRPSWLLEHDADVLAQPLAGDSSYLSQITII